MKRATRRKNKLIKAIQNATGGPSTSKINEGLKPVKNVNKTESTKELENPLRGQKINNLDIYPLVCQLLGIEGLPGDYNWNDSLLKRIITL
jgi:hypothetical protein